MVGLLDANLLIALAWPTHIHHRPARDWFGRSHAGGWATCSLTEVAFMRISMNRRVFPKAPTTAKILDALTSMRARPGHHFFEDSVSLPETPFAALVVGHNQVTDAHLLALAHARKAKLVTFDQAVRQLVPPGFDPASVLEILTA